MVRYGNFVWFFGTKNINCVEICLLLCYPFPWTIFYRSQSLNLKQVDSLSLLISVWISNFCWIYHNHWGLFFSANLFKWTFLPCRGGNTMKCCHHQWYLSKFILPGWLVTNLYGIYLSGLLLWYSAILFHMNIRTPYLLTFPNVYLIKTYKHHQVNSNKLKQFLYKMFA